MKKLSFCVKDSFFFFLLNTLLFVQRWHGKSAKKIYQERQITYNLFISFLKLKHGTWQFGTGLRSGKLLAFNVMDLTVWREQGKRKEKHLDCDFLKLNMFWLQRAVLNVFVYLIIQKKPITINLQVQIWMRFATLCGMSV